MSAIIPQARRPWDRCAWGYRMNLTSASPNDSSAITEISSPSLARHASPERSTGVLRNLSRMSMTAARRAATSSGGTWRSDFEDFLTVKSERSPIPNWECSPSNVRSRMATSLRLRTWLNQNSRIAWSPSRGSNCRAAALTRAFVLDSLRASACAFATSRARATACVARSSSSFMPCPANSFASSSTRACNRNIVSKMSDLTASWSRSSALGGRNTETSSTASPRIGICAAPMRASFPALSPNSSVTTTNLISDS